MGQAVLCCCSMYSGIWNAWNEHKCIKNIDQHGGEANSDACSYATFVICMGVQSRCISPHQSTFLLTTALSWEMMLIQHIQLVGHWPIHWQLELGEIICLNRLHLEQNGLIDDITKKVCLVGLLNINWQEPLIKIWHYSISNVQYLAKMYSPECVR